MALGDTATLDQCDALQAADIAKAQAGIARCVTKPLTVGQKAALADFAYNVGVPRACGSTLVRKLNAGEPPAVWCAELKRWVYAAGKELPGLVARRQSEYELCIG